MSSARQIRLVAFREIRARFQSKAYQLSTVAIAVLAVGGVLAAQILPDLFEDDPFAVGLTPETASREASLVAAGEAFNREVTVTTYDESPEAEAALAAGDLDAVFAVPDVLLFHDEVDTTLEAIVRQSLFAETLAERADSLGLSIEEAQSLVAPPVVDSQTLAPPESEGDDQSSDIGQGIGALSAIVLLMAISFYGQWVLVGVIEEKSNRVVEALLSAVAPWELLVGKVLGILALALCQIVVGGAAFTAALLATAGADALPTVAVAGLALAVLWLVVGLLLYNFLYAAVGATVNRPEEATSASFPLMVPMMGGYFVGLIFIPDNPDSLIARVLSILPLTAPLTMPSRIASGGGSPLEVVVAVVLALLALAGVIWLAARIYSGGILQSSKVGLLAAFRRSRDIR